MRPARTVLLAALTAIAATVAPSAALAATAAVTTAPALSTVTLNLTDVVGGTPVVGTVRLTSAATAGGVAVALTSDNPAAATVQPSVTVPAGATSATFPVTTLVVTFPQTSLIIGTAGGITAYGILTVRATAQAATGSLSILPAGNGSGVVTSSPAGISCTITLGSGAGACSSFFPTGTVVSLTARAAAGSKFAGWRGTPGCGDPSRITITTGSNITCQGGFVAK